MLRPHLFSRQHYYECRPRGSRHRKQGQGKTDQHAIRVSCGQLRSDVGESCAVPKLVPALFQVPDATVLQPCVAVSGCPSALCVQLVMVPDSAEDASSLALS
jgi:hypothetical protein